MARVEDMVQNMMRWFDSSNENAKETRVDVANIGQKVDAHAVSIKHLELQNPCKPDTLHSNTIKNPKKDGHCMEALLEEVRRASIHICRL